MKCGDEDTTYLEMTKRVHGSTYSFSGHFCADHRAFMLEKYRDEGYTVSTQWVDGMLGTFPCAFDLSVIRSMS
jgi:hypothetical protein